MGNNKYKKLYPRQKALVDKAIRAVMGNPELGEEKKQDLAGVFVHLGADGFDQ